MSPEERNTVTALACSVLVIGYGALQLQARHSGGHFAGPDAVLVWARQVLWLIGLGIGFTIAATILVAIVRAILFGQDEPADLVDERDRMIRGWGLRVTLVVTSAGFLAALAVLALGWPVLGGLNLMLGAFAIGAFLGDLAKFALYRRGG